MWFDNHCHLTSMGRDPDQAVAAAEARRVTRLLTVGCTVADSHAAAALAERYARVWATAGVHPHDARDGLDGLEAALDHPKVVAVGECGLDYYYDHSPRPVQADSFARQIELAHRRDLALVIHSRDAWEDTFDLLDRQGVPRRTVFHCFTGGPDEAAAAVERGAYVSFSGIVTFDSAQELRDAAVAVPANRILVETDSPYLAPVPHRGRPNEPANVAVVGEFVAALLGRSVVDFAAETTANALRLYGLDRATPDPAGGGPQGAEVADPASTAIEG